MKTMSRVAVLVAHGTEETEAIGIVDVLRRGGVEVTMVAVDSSKEVVGSHDIVLRANRTISDVQGDLFDAIVLPGGLPGAANFDESKELDAMIEYHDKEGRLICAICASPMVLGKRGLLKGKKASAYPGFEKYLEGAQYTSCGVSQDGRVITGRGPAYVFEFGVAILSSLAGEEAARTVAKALLMNER